MKYIVKLCFFLVVFFAAASSASADQQQGTPPEKITIQLKWRHQFQFAGYYAAIEKGFYAQEGLDVTLRERDMKKNYVEEVVRGKAQYGTADAGLILDRGQGKPVVLLAQIFQHSPLVFLARKEIGIVSPYDMIGKTVRYEPKDGNFAPLTATLLETIGDPAQVVAVPQSYDLQSFARGEVDVISAYLTDQPFQLEKMGVPVVVIRPDNYGVDFYGDNLFTVDDEIKNHPDRVEKVVRATLRGWRYALNHKEEIIDIIASRYAPGADRQLLTQEAKMTQVMIIPELVELGHVNLHRYDRIAYLYAKLGLLDQAVVPEGFFYRQRNLALTAAEQAWLAAHPTIRAGVVLHGEPLAFVDRKGELQGVDIDCLQKMTERLGVDLRLVPGTSAELAAKVRDREIDLIANAGRESFGSGEGLAFTRPYDKIDMGIFALETVNYISDLASLRGRNVAVLQDSPVKAYLKMRYPQIHILPVSDLKSGLSQLISGKAFAFAGNALTINQAIRQGGHSQIHMVGESDFAITASVAVPEDTPALIGLMQKATERLSAGDRAGLYAKWVPLTHETPPDYSLIWKIGAALLLFALLIVAWNRRLAAEVRKRTASLEESETLFRKLFEDHSAVKFIIDPDKGRIVDANWAAADYYGWPREKLRQMRVQDINTQPPETIKKNLEKTKNSKQQFFEFRHRLADGTVRDVAVFSSGIKHKGKSLLHSIVHDITDQKNAEKALAASEKELRALISSMDDIVMIFDGNGIYRRIFPNNNDLLYRQQEELLGKKLKDVFPPEKARCLADAISRALKSRQTVRIQYDFLIEGKTKYFDASVSFMDKDRVVWVARDITEHHELEEKFYQAQKLESVGRLAGGVAHDFNNMLSIILGYGEILLQELHPGDPLRNDAHAIVEAGKRSAALTRQLLAFSRKQTLQPEVLNLNDVLQNLEKMLRRLIGEDIDMGLSLADELNRVLADPGQIEQVIMNLAVNARDAMPTGGKLIIETAGVELDETYAQNHVSVQPGKYVMLAVTDTGCGMDKETLSHVFEPFFSTKEKGKGTGLGLATVYGIVKQSGGNIWVYSEAGSGTTFKIYLPPTEVEQDPAMVVLEEETTKGGGEHILVVEDEEGLRKLLEATLSRQGYKVSLAANGGEALLLVEEKGLKPDMVVTDVVMPNMSGKEMVNRLRKNQTDLKVLYMSGYTDNAIVHHGVLDPGTPFIQKPFTLRDIAEKVKEVLRWMGRQE